jgi:hypothetical protein
MSKHDNLYKRLTDSEEEFRGLLIRELEALLHSGYSSYLSVRSGQFPIGKKAKNSHTVYMIKLENEIIKLREKILGNTEFGILKVTEELAEIYQHRYNLNDEDIKLAAKNVLHELLTTEDDSYQTIIEILGQITVSDKYPVRDIIVKARKDHFFPMSFRELSDLLEITDSL